ncbi:MAG: hypothetical protein ACKON9_31170, partial [Planctomycetaceae bacterium]
MHLNLGIGRMFLWLQMVAFALAGMTTLAMAEEPAPVPLPPPVPVAAEPAMETEAQPPAEPPPRTGLLERFRDGPAEWAPEGPQPN